MAAEAFLPDRVEIELDATKTTAELVSDYLRRVVHRGELGPGDRLPAERQLAVTLGVSRVTLREAIQTMEDEGYLVRRRGVTGGAFITDLTQPFNAWKKSMKADSGPLDELWDLREAVEVQIARLAATRRTAAELTALQETDAELRATDTRADFRRVDLQFHGALAEAAHSYRLKVLMYATRGHLFSPVEPTVVATRVKKAADGHATVIEAIKKKDANAAGEAMREHLTAARTEMHKALGIS